MSKIMWMVRAGEHADMIDEFVEKSLVSIGWNSVGDLSPISSPEQVRDLAKKVYSDWKLGKIYITAGQISRFRFDFKLGDTVISYNPNKRVYHVGEIASEYMFDSKSTFQHVRKVKWIGEVSRDKLSVQTKNTIGAISTIFEVGANGSDEILSLLNAKDKPTQSISEVVKKDEGLDILKHDMKARSNELIADIIVKLDWDEMQELVAGLLRGMGYKTMISEAGPDRGRDIVASPDGLGLQDPVIIVEVKHRSGQMGSKEVRSFLGGLRERQKGLFVSIGGFSKEARYEAERSKESCQLIDLHTLVRMISQYYDNFDMDTKELVPLTKIYWPS